MSTSLKAALAVIALVIGVGVVVALNSGDDGGDAAGVTTTAVSGDGSGTVATTAGTAATTSPGTVDDCDLVGVWNLRDVEYFAELNRITGGASGEFEYRSGEYEVELGADGTYTGRRMAWSFRVAFGTGALVNEISSEDPGTWSVTGDILEVVESTGDAVVSAWLEQDGTLVPMPGGTDNAVTYPGFGGAGTFECSAAVLVMHIETDGGPLTATFDRQS